MNKDLEVYTSMCQVCNAYPADQGKAPVISHDIPSRPWETIASDLFELDGRLLNNCRLLFKLLRSGSAPQQDCFSCYWQVQTSSG